MKYPNITIVDWGISGVRCLIWKNPGESGLYISREGIETPAYLVKESPRFTYKTTREAIRVVKTYYSVTNYDVKKMAEGYHKAGFENVERKK